MALVQHGVVKVSELKAEHFIFDDSAKKIGVAHGLAQAQLSGTDLKLTLNNADVKTVSLASLVPSVAAEIFLKAVRYDDVNKKLVFTVGEKDKTDSDTTLEVLVSDLIPVTTGAGIDGNGTAANPLTLNKTTVQTMAKEAATITLQSAFGDDIAKAFPV